ncbi:MAG: TetR/AcrR family transcriptional regulator [Anaerolineales bacterium]
MRGEDRKALILEQAKGVFARKGYREASTGELARASGITEPILYKHFGSKRKLYLAVIKKLSDEFLERLRDMVERRAGKDLLDSLNSLLLDYRNAAMADHDNIHLLLNATLESNDPEVMQLTQAHNRAMFALVHGLLERAQKQDLVSRQLDLSAATWGYLSLLIALQYRARENNFGEFNEKTIREINRLWLQALRIG